MAVSREALDKLLDLIGGDPGSLAELIESFLDEAPQLIDKMKQAAGAQDQAALGRAAHTLKSSACDFGANQLSASCGVLEKLCRDGMPERAGADVKEIAAECIAVQKELNLYLIELRQGVIRNE